MERPDLAEDVRFKRTTDRIVNRDALIPEIQRTMLTRTCADWLDRLEAADVPCGPINNYKQVFDDPQVIHRQMPPVGCPRSARRRCEGGDAVGGDPRRRSRRQSLPRRPGPALVR